LSSIIFQGACGGLGAWSASRGDDNVRQYNEYIGGDAGGACEDQPNEAPNIPYIEEYGRYSVLPIPMPEPALGSEVEDGETPHNMGYIRPIGKLQEQLLEISLFYLLTYSLPVGSRLQILHRNH